MLKNNSRQSLALQLLLIRPDIDFDADLENYAAIHDYFQGNSRGAFLSEKSLLDPLEDNSPYSSLEMLNMFRSKLIEAPTQLKYILDLIKEEGELTQELTLEYAPYLLGGSE